jgi:hypothetical protein
VCYLDRDMSSPATGSIYSVVTFIALGAAFVLGTRAAFGWEFPSDNRSATTVMAVYLIASGVYAMFVGRHRDVAYGEALQRGAIDVGRKLKSLVMR